MSNSRRFRCRPPILAALLLAGCGGDAVVAQVKGHGEPPTLIAAPPITALVQACDANAPPVPPAPGGLCEEGGWCWDSPSPTGRDMRGIARVGDEIWAASRAGVIGFDGTEWSPRDTPVTEAWFVWGDAQGVAFVAGDYDIARFDGRAWATWDLKTGNAPPGYEYLDGAVVDLFARSATDVWVVAGAPTLNEQGDGIDPRRLMHFDGNAWTPVAGELPVGGLHDISVASSADIWGISGGAFTQDLVHFDGTAWSTVDLTSVPGAGTEGWPFFDVLSVHAVNARDVWLGGHEPTLLHFDGSTFREVANDAPSAVSAIFGDDPADITFGTLDGEFLHWDGKRVALEQSASSTRAVFEFARDASGKLYSVANGPWKDWRFSGAIVERENGTWTDHTVSDGRDYATKTWGSAWNDVWAVGTGGLRLHFDGTRWEKGSPARSTITGVWGSSRDDVWTVTDNGNIDHFDGTEWTTISESGLPFTDVWGIGNGELWMSVSTSYGAASAARFTRGRLDRFYFGDAESATAVWAASTLDVWVGTDTGNDYGHLYRFDGRKWTSREADVSGPITDLWGRGSRDVYATAGSPTLHHFDGLSWERVTVPFLDTDPDRDSALWGCDEHLFVADAIGIAHFDGSEWTATPQYTRGITGLWAASPNFGVAVGYGGQILRKSR